MRVDQSIGKPALVAVTLSLAGWTLVAWTADPAAYEQPRNTISLGIQGQYGLLGGADDPIPEDPVDGSWGSLFDFGEGIAVRVRYSLARNRAVGLSFEDQRFRRQGGLNSDVYPDQLQLTQVMGEYYFYFARPRKVTQYVVFGAGIHRPTIRIEKEDTTGRKLEENTFPGMNLTVMVGAGLEYFLGRQASIDVSLRGYGINSDPSRTATGELALGLHYYTK